MTKIIGLTGGIGSGKTTIAKYFSEWGVPVYIADDAAREVMEQPEILRAISEQFGDEIISDGILNRKELARKVFENPNQLIALNSIVHPAVRKHFEKWLQNHINAPFVIKEAAILFESGSYKDCDEIITVSAAEDDRIKRVINRDTTSIDEVRNRIANQWSDHQRQQKSDYIIFNDDGSDARAQAFEIFTKLMQSF